MRTDFLAVSCQFRIIYMTHFKILVTFSGHYDLKIGVIQICPNMACYMSKMNRI